MYTRKPPEKRMWFVVVYPVLYFCVSWCCIASVTAVLATPLLHSLLTLHFVSIITEHLRAGKTLVEQHAASSHFTNIVIHITQHRVECPSLSGKALRRLCMGSGLTGAALCLAIRCEFDAFVNEGILALRRIQLKC